MFFAENQRGRVGELLIIYIIRLYKMTSIWDTGLKYNYFDFYSINTNILYIRKDGTESSVPSDLLQVRIMLKRFSISLNRLRKSLSDVVPVPVRGR